MINRQKRLRIIQFFLLGFGALISDLFHLLRHKWKKRLLPKQDLNLIKQKLKMGNEGKVSGDADTFL